MKTNHYLNLVVVFFILFTVQGQNYVNITSYGASPSLDDNSAQIQQAIDANPNRTIYFPAGSFTIKSPIRINEPVVLIGEGMDQTYLRPEDTNGIVINVPNVTIKNMFIYGKKKNASGNHIGILCYGRKDVTDEDNVILENRSLRKVNIESVRIQNIYIGIELKYTWQAVIDKVRIEVNPEQNPQVSQGIRYYGKSVNNQISNSYVVGNFCSVAVIRERLSGQSGVPIKDLTEDRAEGLMITNSFLGSGEYGIYSEGILGLQVSNNVIDLVKRTAVEGTSTDGMFLSNNWIATKESIPHPVIKMINSIEGSISNNRIEFYVNGDEEKPYFNVKNNTGLSFEHGSARYTVIGNIFKGVLNPTLNPAGSGNVVVNNITF